jgi:hypothetical protein
MVGGMRYTIAVLVFITLACSKTESSSEGAAETTEAAAPTATRPTIELVAKGTPPLRKIRWSFQEGAKEVLVMTTAQVLQMKGGGWDNRYVPTGIAQTIDVATQAVSANGTAEVAFHIREVAELETADANSAPIEGAKGWTGTYRVDSTGVIRNLVLEPSPNAERTAEQLDALKGLIRLTVFPVPAEAIGVGAKWTVAQIVHEYETRMSEHMTIELLELDGSHIVLRVEVKGRGSKQSDLGGKPQTISLDTNNRVLAKLSSTKLVPRSSELKNHTIQTVKVAGVDGPLGRLDVTIDRTVKMQSN